MRQAIVLTSFGVADAAERARTIDCIALDLRAKFKDYDVLEAYTSAFLRKKIRAQEGREIPALPDVLERLVRDAYTRALILPTHLTAGEEYEAKIRAPYEAYRDRLADLRLLACQLRKQRVGVPLRIRVGQHRFQRALSELCVSKERIERGKLLFREIRKHQDLPCKLRRVGVCLDALFPAAQRADRLEIVLALCRAQTHVLLAAQRAKGFQFLFVEMIGKQRRRHGRLLSSEISHFLRCEMFAFRQT